MTVDGLGMREYGEHNGKERHGMEYNGWTNYETWSVSLIMTNTQTTERDYTAFITERYAINFAAAVASPIFPERGVALAVMDGLQIAHFTTADDLKDWLGERLSEYANVANISGVMPRDWNGRTDIGAWQRGTREMHAERAEQFRMLAAQLLQSALDNVDYHDLVRAVLDSHSQVIAWDTNTNTAVWIDRAACAS